MILREPSVKKYGKTKASIATNCAEKKSHSNNKSDCITTEDLRWLRTETQVGQFSGLLMAECKCTMTKLYVLQFQCTANIMSHLSRLQRQKKSDNNMAKA